MNWLEILGWQEDQLQELRFIGFSMLQQGHYQKAAIYFEGLTCLNPNYAYDRRTLGALYLQMGLDEKALEQLNTALTLEPNHELAKLNKVKALLMLGKKDEALVVAKQLLQSSNTRVANDASALILAYS